MDYLIIIVFSAGLVFLLTMLKGSTEFKSIVGIH